MLRNEPSGHTLQATALVNEAYLRLLGLDSSLAERRERFLGVAARAMRQILIDHARSRSAQKRGGDRKREPLVTGIGAQDGPDDWLLALGEAMERLEAVDAQLARLVELRYFAGLTFEQAALVLEVAPITAKRMWKLATAWLHREMSED